MVDSYKRNFLSLTVVQVGNYVVPLITLPWLTRNLGIDEYGRLGFATAVIAYFVLLTDWGFLLGSTRDISVVKEDPQKRSCIFWDVIAGRILLGFFGLFVLLTLTWFVEKLSDDIWLLCSLLPGVFASVFSPWFYLQGIERMAKAAVINLCVKFSTVPLIFLMVNDRSDIYTAAFIQSFSLLVACIFNCLDLFRTKEIIFVSPLFIRVIASLKKNSNLFVANLAIGLYTNSSAVILGFVASEAAVGAFLAAYNLIKAVIGLMGPLSQALFPRVSHLLIHNRSGAEILLRRMFKIQIIMGTTLGAGFLVVSPIIIPLVFGASYFQAVPVLYILGVLPLLISISNVLGIQVMVPLGYNREFCLALIAAGLCNIVLVFSLGSWCGGIGAAVSMVAAEMLVTCIMAWFIKKYEPSIWTHLFTQKGVLS